MKYLQSLFITVVFLVAGCTPPHSYFFSFENDMEGWSSNGTDLDNPPVEWSIERTQKMAKDGTISLAFYLDNLNDQGKIWVEQSFVVKPDCLYYVSVEYTFASADFGEINLWQIITGVTKEQPVCRDNLIYQENTSNNSKTDVGFRWLEKDYDFIIQSDSGGRLWVTIGIWGTWETPRTYYIDNVQITFTEKSFLP